MGISLKQLPIIVSFLRHFGVLWLITLSVFSTPVYSAPSLTQCESNDPRAINIVVASRRESIEALSVQRGVQEACQQKWKTPINVSYQVYDEISDGYKFISNLIENSSASKRVDVIIGPTESQVYSNLIEFQNISKRPVPIVSPIVTLRSGNESDGWFFRTNVDATKRTRTMYDFLVNRNVENIALLYVDRTFGEIVESEFRKELTETQRESFRSYRFKTSEDARQWVRQINKFRPEAIGIIGSRDDIKNITPMFNHSSHVWSAYDPYVFTIIDARSLKENGSYFLSVGSESKVQEYPEDGEVLDLSYDTARLIMGISDRLFTEGMKPNNVKWREKFRDRLVVSLFSSPFSQTRTGMEFSGYRNMATPKVMTVLGEEATTVSDPFVESWFPPFSKWKNIRERRFGNALYINIVIIGIVVLFLTVFDLKKSHRVRTRSLIEPQFIVLMLFNSSVAIGVFIFMAEYQVLEWNSFFGAVLVALGYAGLLKTTIFESETGKAFGAKFYYDCLVSVIYDNIRKRQFEKKGPTINYIVYANSIKNLRGALNESYGFARDNKRRDELIEKLDKLVEKESTTIGQRTVLAKAVMNELSWDKMIQRKIVPFGSCQDEIRDPEPTLNKSVTYCMRMKTISLKEMKERVIAAIKDSTLADEFFVEYEASTTPRSRMLSCVRWIMILEGYDVKKMILEGYLPEEGSSDQERRNDERVPKDDDIEVSLNDVKLKGRLKDISENGARIVFDDTVTNYPQKQQVSILGHNEQDENANKTIKNIPFNVTNRKTNKKGDVEIGVCWETLSKPDVNNLKELLSSDK